MDMKELLHTINDPNGIHARPAGLFVEKMQQFKSLVTVRRDEQSADGKKLFALMKLRPKYGQTLLITTEGEDEEDAIEAAREFLTVNL
jgi:phosphotransferase system HPr (HPr) family protein